MESEQENQGFEQNIQRYELVQFQRTQTPATQASKPSPPALTPPISTFTSIGNHATPEFINEVYSSAPTPQDQSKASQNEAWCCLQERHLQQQFTADRYDTIYCKFPQEKSNYNFYRQYAKSEYKLFTDPDPFDDEHDQCVTRGKKNLLDLSKIEQMMCPQSKCLKFNSNFQCGNLDRVFMRKQVKTNPGTVLRKTACTLEASSLCSSTIPEAECSQPNEYFLVLSNDTNTAGFNQWFYFKVTNPNYDNQIEAKLVIVNINKKLISNIGEVGVRMFSVDQFKLFRTGWVGLNSGLRSNQKNNLGKDDQTYYQSLEFQIVIRPRDVVYFSLALPYSFTKLKNYIERNPCGFSTLGSTFTGNPLYLYKCGNEQAEKSIIITARQHPSETSSSYVAQGIIDRLSGPSSPLIELLKKRYQIYVLPMVNPDGVIHGNSRTNLLGFDINRKWQAVPNRRHSYEVSLIVEQLLSRASKVEYLIDLHGHSKKLNSFAYFSTKRSFAAAVCCQMADKLQWFSTSDCMIASAAPPNTLRWYASLDQQVEKSITIETSIHGWRDKNGRVLGFKPHEMQAIGATFIDVIAKLEFQKKSVRRNKVIKFSDCHESSDSDPERDYLKTSKLEVSEQQNKQQSPQKVLPLRRLRIKTCSTHFYKPTANSTIRQRIKTEHLDEKQKHETSEKLAGMIRKKTAACKVEKQRVSTRKLTLNYQDFNQSMEFKPTIVVSSSKKPPVQYKKSEIVTKTLHRNESPLKQIHLEPHIKNRIKNFECKLKLNLNSRPK